jgi:hypothetical protein
MSDCCNPMTGACEQGHGCPCRASKVATYKPSQSEVGNLRLDELEPEPLSRADRFGLALICVEVLAGFLGGLYLKFN